MHVCMINSSSSPHLTGMIFIDNMRLPWQPRNAYVKYSETTNMNSQQYMEGEEYNTHVALHCILLHQYLMHVD